MTLLLIVSRSLRQHALSSCVTLISTALASGLLISVWAVKEGSQAAFTGMTGGFDAVLGARAAKLQLVLNAVFHLETSPGNLAWQDYLEIQQNPNVARAVPIAMGDNYRGYRLVGTTLEYFTETHPGPGPRHPVRQPGRLFDPAAREAVVGDFVARRLGLKRGDVIHPFHGLLFDEKEQHAETYLVVGILEPTNTPADRVIWIPLEGIQTMGGHDPSAVSEISAVLVKLKTTLAGRQLELLYNKEGARLTFAWPIGQIMAQLFQKISWFDRVLELIAGLVAFVATGSVLASIYNSMNERRRELAILRALGARRRTLFSAVVLESSAIAAAGAVVGFGVYLAITSGVASVLRAKTGVVLDPWEFRPVLIWAPLGVILAGALAGVVPAVKAYRTPVVENLGPLS